MIHVKLLEPSLPQDCHWQHEWKEADDSTTLSLALHDDGFLLRFPDLCDFILDIRRRHISIIPHESLDDFTIEHLLVDQVLPRFLAYEGHLLLHACAVNIDARTILFLGKSGWGKSTLAALLHQAGYRLYSDDCVLIRKQGEAWQAFPTYPSLRLYEDSIENNLLSDAVTSPVSEYSEKQRVGLSVPSNEDIPAVHAMYFLSDPDTAGESIVIHRMNPAGTCIELIQRSFQLDIANREQSGKLMAHAAALTRSIPAYRLSYPHDFENNSQLLELLVQHIKQ